MSTFTLTDPPKISLPEQITIQENGYFEIVCQADANPPVHEYHWKKNGQVLQEHDVMLIIEHAQPEDMAEYSCEAVNVIKETGASFGQRNIGTANIQVNVECKSVKPITKHAIFHLVRTKVFCLCVRKCWT